MGTTQIYVAYDGESLQSGLMDVRDLAPAFIAIGDLCQETNRVLNGDKAHLSVKVRSGFQRGSFEISLEIMQSIIHHAKSLLLGDDIIAVKTLTELLGFAGGGYVSLITFLKWLKNRKVIGIANQENGDYRIEIEGDHIDVSPNILKLSENIKVREALEGIIKPLIQDGIDRFEVRQGNEIIESIGKGDIPSFSQPEFTEGVTVDNEQAALLEIVRLSFEEKYKWTFTNGNMIFNADIEDVEFLNKLNRREILFAKGDILKVSLYTKSWQTEKGLKTEYKVLRVIEIIPSPRQLQMFSPQQEDK
ncbi:MAG: hypothetical protein HZA08_07340 [Nitrospirae bacterium]|nr:hypothetical protein [Nitrospirota bacterium]